MSLSQQFFGFGAQTSVSPVPEFVIATLSGDGDNRVVSAMVTLEWQHKGMTSRSTTVVVTVQHNATAVWLTLEQQGCEPHFVGPCACGYLFDKDRTVSGFSLPCDFLNTIFFP